jgi:WD40 repeat protein
MRVTMAVATVFAAAAPFLSAEQAKPAQPADRPVRATSTRALVHLVAFAPDNVTVVAWDSGGFAKWNPETGKTVDRQPVIGKACGGRGVPVLPRSEDGRTVAVSCGGKLSFFDIATGEARGEFKFDPKQTPTVYTVSPDFASIATVAAGATATVQISDVKTGERRAVIQNEQEVQQLSFAPIGRVLATGAVDGVRLWQMPDGQLLRTVTGGTFHAISRDGQILALERGRDVAIVDVNTGEVKQTLPATVSQLRFSDDGTLLAGWNNQVLIVWETATGKVRLTLKSSQLVTVALAPDGKHLVAVGMDLAGGGAQTTVAVWRIP